MFVPSPQQQAIFDYVEQHRHRGGRKALAISALAGTGKCVLPETLVSVNGNLLRADEVYSAYATDVIRDKEGFWAIPSEELVTDSFDETSGRFIQKRITALYRQYVDYYALNIRLDDGSSIWLTDQHKLYNGFEWTNRFNEGMTVAVPSKLPEQSGNLDPLLAELVAWFVGEGYDEIRGSSALFAVTLGSETEINRVRDLITQVEAKYQLTPSANTIHYSEKRNVYTIKIQSKGMRLLLESIGYKVGFRAAQKRIPSGIMQAGNESVRIFLRTYFDAEGSVEVKRRVVELTSASKRLIEQIRYLLRRFGVWARLREFYKRATNGSRIFRPYYTITISSTSLRKFSEEIGFSIDYQKEKLAKAIDAKVNPNKELIPSSGPLSYLRQMVPFGNSILGLPDPAYFDTKNLTRTTYFNKVRPRLQEVREGVTFGANQFRPTIHVDSETESCAQEVIATLDDLATRDLHYATIVEIDVAPYQGWIYDFTVEDTHNFVAENILCHNTSSMVELMKRVPNMRGIYCAFNKSIAEEVKPKLKDTGVDAKTFHAMGYGVLKAHLKREYGVPDFKVQTNKYRDLVEQEINRSERIREQIDAAVEASFKPGDLIDDQDRMKARDRITSATKSLMVGLANFGRLKLMNFEDRSDMIGIIVSYDLDEEDRVELVNACVDAMPRIIKAAEKQTEEGIIDYTDMIYWVVRWNLKVWQNNWVFVDEAQDLNPMQREMVRRSLSDNGFIIIVGDPRQSIYAFSGADSDSFDLTVNMFDADVLPLTVTRRCSRIITYHAQYLVPSFEALPDAPRGKFIWLDETSLTKHARPGDMVICRLKAPLVEKTIELLSSGIPASILGSDIGKALFAIAEKVAKQTGFTFDQFGAYLELYEQREHAKWIARGDEQRAASVRDEIKALHSIYTDKQPSSMEALERAIESLFSDDKEQVVLFCTGHKSKGLEADRVFILKPDKMPLRRPNMRPEDEVQEDNLHYVSITRAKRELVILTNEKYRKDNSMPHYAQTDFAEREWPEEKLPEAQQPPAEPAQAEEPAEDMTLTPAERWARRMIQQGFVVVDFETTGRDPHSNEMVQVAIVDHLGNELLNTYVKPTRYEIDPGASAVTGITAETVADAPEFRELYDTFVDILDLRENVIAYNAPFDSAILDHTCEINDCVRIAVVKWHCAMRHYAEYNPEKVSARGSKGAWWKLGEAMEQEGLPLLDAHDALADVRMTVNLVRKLAGEPILTFDQPISTDEPAQVDEQPAPAEISEPAQGEIVAEEAEEATDALPVEEPPQIEPIAEEPIPQEQPALIALPADELVAAEAAADALIEPVGVAPVSPKGETIEFVPVSVDATNISDEIDDEPVPVLEVVAPDGQQAEIAVSPKGETHTEPPKSPHPEQRNKLYALIAGISLDEAETLIELLTEHRDSLLAEMGGAS